MSKSPTFNELMRITQEQLQPENIFNMDQEKFNKAKELEARLHDLRFHRNQLMSAVNRKGGLAYGIELANETRKQSVLLKDKFCPDLTEYLASYQANLDAEIDQLQKDFDAI